jgi:hypothetical protein
MVAPLLLTGGHPSLCPTQRLVVKSNQGPEKPSLFSGSNSAIYAQANIRSPDKKSFEQYQNLRLICVLIFRKKATGGLSVLQLP